MRGAAGRIVADGATPLVCGSLLSVVLRFSPACTPEPARLGLLVAGREWLTVAAPPTLTSPGPAHNRRDHPHDYSTDFLGACHAYPVARIRRAGHIQRCRLDAARPDGVQRLGLDDQREACDCRARGAVCQRPGTGPPADHARRRPRSRYRLLQRHVRRYRSTRRLAQDQERQRRHDRQRHAPATPRLPGRGLD